MASYQQLLAPAVVCILLTKAAAATAVGPDWQHDLPKALHAARDSGKDLVVVFTGRGWCQPCELLNAQVFHDAGFVESTRDDFIFVELDLTFGDTRNEQNRKDELTRLKERYLVGGVPKILVMDEAGVPYATWNGFSSEMTPHAVATTMAEARRQKLLRDKLFAEADAIENESQHVEQVHLGLEAVAPYLRGRDGDTDAELFAFYASQVDAILNSTEASVVRLRSDCAERKAAVQLRSQSLASAAIQAETLAAFSKSKDYRGGVAYIDSLLPDVADEQIYWNLQVRRQGFLEASGDLNEVIENCRQLVSSESIPAPMREQLRDQEARCLALKERLPEAVAQYDRRLAEAKADDKQTLRLLESKAELLQHYGTNTDALAAWKELRAYAKPRSFEWLSGAVYAARALQKEENYREAAVCFHDVLDTLEAGRRGEVELQWPWSPDRGQFVMLEAAECHLALSEREEAALLIEQAAGAIERLRKSPHIRDNESAQRLEEAVAALREKLN